MIDISIKSVQRLKKKYKDGLQTKDGKVLVQNFAYLTLLQICGYVFPIITIPYLARIIGVEGFGKIAFASGIIVWIQTITDWGFNYTATRDLARSRKESDKVSLIFSKVFFSKIFLMLISFFLLVILILSIPQFKSCYDVILITFLIVPGNILFPEWFFQAIEKMKYITIFNIIAKFVCTMCIFIFIRNKSDYILQPLFISLGYIFTGVISYVYIVYRLKVKIQWISCKNIISYIKSNFDVFLTNIVNNLYHSFSVVLLGSWGGTIANGKLDAGAKFVTISNQFIDVLSRTFFPYLSRKPEKHLFYARISILFALIISLLLFITARFLIIIFYTSDFLSSVIVLRIMSFNVLFMTLSRVYGTNYLLINGYEKLMRKIALNCSLIGFIISFPLIYFYSYIGAAITITLARGLLSVSFMYYSNKIIYKK